MTRDQIVSVVDDDASVREATSALVRSLGYIVRVFESAEAFLASGSAQGTACLITDVSMPGLDGFALHHALRDAGHDVPVIFVTAYADAANRQRADAAGAVGFLGKPFNEDRLAACLASVAPLAN